MWGVTSWEKVFIKDERTDLSELRKISNAVWSETWDLRKSEMAILRRTEKVRMRAMCGVEIIEKRRRQELMSLLGLKIL